MASLDSTDCLACGEPALKRARVAAATVSSLLKKYLSVRCQENSWEVDLDAVIGSSFVCRSCSKVYLKHLEKDERLYVATSASVAVLASQQSNSETPAAARKRLASQESALHCATKRQCITQDSAPDSVSPESPPIVVGIGYKSGYRSYPVTSPTRKSFVRQLSRCANSSKSIANLVLKNKEVLKYIANGIGKQIKFELKKLGTICVNSVQRSKRKDDIVNFPWNSIFDEIKEYCPMLLILLYSSTDTATERSNRAQFICMIVCLLSKYHNNRMSLFQKLISAILYAGHSATMVYTRLNNLSFCLSKNSLYNLIISLGEDYDSAVRNWSLSLIPHMPSEIDCDHQIHVCDSEVAVVQDTDLNLFNGENESSEDEGSNDSDDNIHGQVNFNVDRSSDEHECTQSTTGIVHLCNSEDECDASDCNDSIHTPPSPTFSNISFNLDDSLNDAISDAFSEETCEWNGFKIVGDNLDKNISPRHQRIDRKTKSFHFFQSYAVRDRVDFSQTSEEPNLYFKKPVSELPIDKLLPSVSDDQALICNMSTLIGRVLISELSYFSHTFSDVVLKHIEHHQYGNMCKKSETIPLGIIFKNENVVEDMIDIMLDLHKYVPCEKKTKVDASSGCEVPCDVQHSILFGGDQLTRKRAETAKDARQNSPCPTTKLKGLIPVCEDWHAKKIFLEMIWKWLYDNKSFLEKGTLCQLRNLIDRRNISASASDDFNACDDYFVMVVQCHIVSAAMNLLKMKATSDKPDHVLLDDDLWIKSKDDRKQVLAQVTKEICLKYVDILSHHNLEEDIQGDGVKAYAVQVLSQGLLYMEFSDAIREGDGYRILRCWRYLMLVFRSRQRKNYCIEGLNLLAQFHFYLNERQSHQLIWSRCINIHGLPGRNVPCDLFLEHLNKICKQAIETLGSNFSEKALERVGHCVGILDGLLDQFDRDFCIDKLSGRHTLADSEKDKHIIINELVEANVFSYAQNREHKSFKSIKTNIVSSLRYNQKFHKWIAQQLFSIKNKFS